MLKAWNKVVWYWIIVVFIFLAVNLIFLLPAWISFLPGSFEKQYSGVWFLIGNLIWVMIAIEESPESKH